MLFLLFRLVGCNIGIMKDRSSNFKLLAELKYLLNIHPLARNDKNWDRILDLMNNYNLRLPDTIGKVGLFESPYEGFLEEKYKPYDENHLNDVLKELNKDVKYYDFNKIKDENEYSRSMILSKEIRIIENLISDIELKNENQLRQQITEISETNFPIVEWIDSGEGRGEDSSYKDYRIIDNKIQLYTIVNWFWHFVDENEKKVFWSKLPLDIIVCFKIKLIEDLSIAHELCIDFNNLIISDIDFGIGEYYDNNSNNFYMELNDNSIEGYDMVEVRKFFTIISDQLCEKINNNSSGIQNWFDSDYMNDPEGIEDSEIFSTYERYIFNT